MAKIKRPFKDDDQYNPFFWYQASFIDRQNYSHMPESWKESQRKRETTIIRDARHKNGLFQVIAAENPDQVVEAICKLVVYTEQLEDKLKEVKQ